MRSFLGHASYYRRFIDHFSQIAKPLHHLLENNIPYEWNEVKHIAFCKIKDKLVTAPILQPPNWELPFELLTDASDFAIGACLGQYIDKKPIFIAYLSTTTLYHY